MSVHCTKYELNVNTYTADTSSSRASCDVIAHIPVDVAEYSAEGQTWRFYGHTLNSMGNNHAWNFVVACRRRRGQRQIEGGRKYSCPWGVAAWTAASHWQSINTKRFPLRNIKERSTEAEKRRQAHQIVIRTSRARRLTVAMMCGRAQGFRLRPKAMLSMVMDDECNLKVDANDYREKGELNL